VLDIYQTALPTKRPHQNSPENSSEWQRGVLL
jgi:hypothetical protein